MARERDRGGRGAHPGHCSWRARRNRSPSSGVSKERRTMRSTRILAALLMLSIAASGPGLGLAAAPARPTCSRGCAAPATSARRPTGASSGCRVHTGACTRARRSVVRPDLGGHARAPELSHRRGVLLARRAPKLGARDTQYSARPGRHPVRRTERQRRDPDRNARVRARRLRHADRPRQPGTGLHPVPRHERPGGPRPARAVAELHARARYPERGVHG